MNEPNTKPATIIQTDEITLISHNGNRVYFKGVCHEMLRILLDQHANFFIKELGHAMPIPMATIGEKLGTSMEATKSALQRIRTRTKDIPLVKNIYGVGHYLEMPQIVQK